MNIQPQQSTLQNFQPKWLTLREAADYLQVRPRTLAQWVRVGKVKGFALSGTKRRVWRFLQQDLDTAVMQSPVLLSTTPAVLNERRIM